MTRAQLPTRAVVAVAAAASLAIAGGVSVAGSAYLKSNQEWTSVVEIQFTNPDASRGYAIDGTKTETVIEELKSSAVLAPVAAKLGDVSPDQLSDHITIAASIPPEEAENRNAMLDNGKEYEYFPDTYTVSYTTNDNRDIQRELWLITQGFYDQFTRNHLPDRDMPADASSTVDVEGDEYLSSVDVLSDHIDEMISFLEEEAEKYPDWRSSRTGMAYKDLLAVYTHLKQWDCARLYANIFAHKAAKHPDVIVANARKENGLGTDRSVGVRSDIDELRKLIGSYSEKNKADVLEDRKLDENHDSILDDVIENDHETDSAYDELISKFVAESDDLTLTAQQSTYNDYVISVFEDAGPVSEDLDATLVGWMRELTGKIDRAYERASLSDQEHRQQTGADNVRSISTPDKNAKYNIRLYGIIFFVGTFVCSFIAILWAVAFKRNFVAKLDGGGDDDDDAADGGDAGAEGRK